MCLVPKEMGRGATDATSNSTYTKSYSLPLSTYTLYLVQRMNDGAACSVNGFTFP